MDVLVCEDAIEHCRPLSCLASDYEKFFNTVQLSVSDAIDELRGFPECVRQLSWEVFSGLELRVRTQWSDSDPVRLSRGVPQGSVSGPELSKAGQELILRLRELSPAKYITSSGRAVASAGFVDDPQHYLCTIK